MRIYSTLLLLLMMGIATRSNAQEPVKILFIGNSFTGANDLHMIVKPFMDAGGSPAHTVAYAPGGISVGDVAMGTAAHMNNPLVFDMIRREHWDYMVLQDNQGRFALDSGIFPSSSKVIEGHLKIRDSLHFYHPCAKMIWFSGWGFEDEDTVMINKITDNYGVLNDQAKDVIAPIGPAWKNSIIERPHFRLWSPDGAHPDVNGSYLTAAIIYGTITQKDVTMNPFPYRLPPGEADFLKRIAQETLSNPEVAHRSNLQGIVPLGLSWGTTELKGDAGKKLYRWYRNDTLLSATSDSVLTPTVSGKYRLWAEDEYGNWQKSCTVEVKLPATDISEVYGANALLLFPNPATDAVTVQNIGSEVYTIEIFSLLGQQQLSLNRTGTTMNININALPSGMYYIKCLDVNKQMINGTGKFVKQ